MNTGTKDGGVGKLPVRIWHLVVVLVGFGLVVMLCLPVWSTVSYRSPMTVTLAHAKQLALACKLYARDHAWRHPASLKELVPKYLEPGLLEKLVPMEERDGKLVPSGQRFTYFPGLHEEAPADLILLAGPAHEESDRRVVITLDQAGQLVRDHEYKAMLKRYREWVDANPAKEK